MPEITLDGGGADPFASPQAAAIDAVQMLAENHHLERFARPLARQNPWEALPEVPPIPPPQTIPFGVGETLTYRVTWTSGPMSVPAVYTGVLLALAIPVLVLGVYWQPMIRWASNAFGGGFAL